MFPMSHRSFDSDGNCVALRCVAVLRDKHISLHVDITWVDIATSGFTKSYSPSIQRFCGRYYHVNWLQNTHTHTHTFSTPLRCKIAMSPTACFAGGDRAMHTGSVEHGGNQVNNWWKSIVALPRFFLGVRPKQAIE